MPSGSQLHFEILGQLWPVEHIVKPGQKHAYLSIRQGKIRVSSPKISVDELLDLLHRQQHWLSQKIQALPDPSLETKLPEGLYLLGRYYPFQQVQQSNFAATKLQRTEDKIVIYQPAAFSEQALIRSAIERFLMLEGRDYLLERLGFWSAQMDLLPRRVRFKNLQSRWGSCSYKQNINLNVRAIQLPPRCIDSILIHELAHLEHLNHGPHFWNLVHRFMPDYELQSQTIKAFQGDLF